MSVPGPLSWLAQTQSYREALGALRERRAELVEAGTAGDLAFADLPEQQDAELARLLAKSVTSGSYTFGLVQEKRAHLGGKWRQVYRASLADTVVLMVLARPAESVTGPMAPPVAFELVKVPPTSVVALARVLPLTFIVAPLFTVTAPLPRARLLPAITVPKAIVVPPE